MLPRIYCPNTFQATGSHYISEWIYWNLIERERTTARIQASTFIKRSSAMLFQINCNKSTTGGGQWPVDPSALCCRNYLSLYRCWWQVSFFTLFLMATQDIDDFLEDDLLNQHIAFPPEVLAAIDQVMHSFVWLCVSCIIHPSIRILLWTL